MNISSTERSFQGLTSAQLKLVAMIIMLIDHMGAFLLPPESAVYALCRLIGRLAFPIFCFLIAEGARHTRSLPGYMARLGAFALISTPPYNLVHGSAWYSFKTLNVFFTLLLGLAAIGCIQNPAPRCFQKTGRNDLAESRTACVWLGLPCCIVLYLAAFALNVDYGGYGVAAILLFWLLRERPVAAWGLFALITFVCYDFVFVKYGEVGMLDYAAMNPYDMVSHCVWQGGYQILFVNARQIAAVFAAIPCALYNGQKGRLLPSKSIGETCEKYLFYAFYPAHLLVLWVVQIMVR